MADILTGEDLAKQHREISVSEFFEKNKHLLGFDNPTKALLIVVKEAVDNSLDACNEAGILPKIIVKVKNVENDIFRVTIEDNGPGIPKEKLAKTFGKFLYGSKFHRLRQSAGQQGIGITGSILYAQLTTGRSARIWSKTAKEKKTHYIELMIDVTKNEPHIIKREDIEGRKEIKEHGVRIELDIVGRYRRTQSVDDYLEQVSISNPYAEIIYYAPDGRKVVYSRAVKKLPKLPKEIKPHPYGVELGIFLRMLKNTRAKTIFSFLTNEFSSVGAKTAEKACQIAKIRKNRKPQELSNEEAKKLLQALQSLDIQRPPLDCLSPIGEEALKNGLRKHYPNAEFIATVTREPNVYRGNPFQVEAAIVYDPTLPSGEIVKLIRFANKAPLLYQQGACAIFKAVTETDWKRYGLDHRKGSLPSGPYVIVVHLCSVWVPFISEGKEAIASYPVIVKEIKLALQKVARKLAIYLSGKRREHQRKKRFELFQRYAPEIEDALYKLTGIDREKIRKMLEELIRERVKVSEEDEKGDNENVTSSTKK